VNVEVERGCPSPGVFECLMTMNVLAVGVMVLEVMLMMMMMMERCSPDKLHLCVEEGQS